MSKHSIKKGKGLNGSAVTTSTQLEPMKTLGPPQSDSRCPAETKCIWRKSPHAIKWTYPPWVIILIDTQNNDHDNLIIAHNNTSKINKPEKSTHFERFSMPRAYHVFRLVNRLLKILINNRLDKPIKLFFRRNILSSIISQRTFKVSYPFIIPTTSIMPSVIWSW